MITKNPHEQKLRRTDIATNNIAINIFNNSKLLSEFFISAHNKLNIEMVIPLSASKVDLSLPVM